MIKKSSVDIVIFGGGIAGLYTLNRLRSLGYSVALFETQALGSGQTSRSQGIIHGGIKFALQGALTGGANAVAEMPDRWKACLQGEGEVDLRNTKILSEEQLLWSTGSLGSEVMAFFASKSLNSRVQKLKSSEYPIALKNSSFKGHVWRLAEVVLDTQSLLQTLSAPHQEALFKISPNTFEFCFTENEQRKKLKSILFKPSTGSSSDEVELTAKHYLLAAGEGNAVLSQHIRHETAQQCRPLQMVLVKWSTHIPLFAHCIDSGMNPRITVTTHITADGKSVWYIGGQLAEDGAQRTKEAQLFESRKEIKRLFPWLDLSNAQFESFYINRAESKQTDGKRPESFFLQTIDNVSVAWPTKLALSPLLADHFINTLDKNAVNKSTPDLEALKVFEKPGIATPVWDELF